MAVRDDIDAQLAVLLPAIRARQDIYFAGRGSYFQGILTPAIRPADGAIRAVDPTLRPTDQSATWGTFFPALPATLPMSIEIHTHNGPLGKGYTVYSHVIVFGDNFVRADGTGLHSNTFGWLRTLPFRDSLNGTD